MFFSLILPPVAALAQSAEPTAPADPLWAQVDDNLLGKLVNGVMTPERLAQNVEDLRDAKTTDGGQVGGVGMGYYPDEVWCNDYATNVKLFTDRLAALTGATTVEHPVDMLPDLSGNGNDATPALTPAPEAETTESAPAEEVKHVVPAFVASDDTQTPSLTVALHTDHVSVWHKIGHTFTAEIRALEEKIAGALKAWV